MAEVSTAPANSYQPPNPIEVPPLYSWPPRPLATLRWFATGLLFPWGLIFIGMAVVVWNYLTPGIERMVTLEPGWMALIWLRNAALLTLVAGGLHWWLHILRKQDRAYSLLHWPPLYRAAHQLHHRNVDTGPWSGIAMHPLEHLIYFTVFLLWWLVPVHPVIVILTGLYQGISPAVSHSGFDQLVLGGRMRVTAGDHFHHLHHKYFEVNYGNTPTPLDKLFGTWHDGTPECLAAFRDRRRGEQKVRRRIQPL